MKKNTPKFRIATKEDISLIQQMAREIWYDTYTDMIPERQIEYMLEKMYSNESISFFMNKEYTTHLIYLDDPAGYYSLEKRIQSELIYIHRLYVRKEFQGQGLGLKSLEKIIEDYKSLKIKKIQLNVNRNNMPAIHTYKKFGFEIIREADTNIGNGFFMNDYLMELKI